MMKEFLFVIITLLTVAASCDNMPIRDFTVELYKFQDDPCLKWIDDHSVKQEACPGDELYPKKVVGITARDYSNERNYQDVLLSSCEKWTQRCGSAPLRSFTIELYSILGEPCVEWKNDKDEVEQACFGDENFPVGLIGITPSDYTKERDYQSEIIACCAVWKDNKKEKREK